jgi:hypothetical protein
MSSAVGVTPRQLRRQAMAGHSSAREIVLCPAGHRLESTVRYLGIEVDDAL